MSKTQLQEQGEALMERTPIAEMKPDTDILIQGWIHDIRDLANVKFIILRDRTGIVQCVIKKDNTKMFELVPQLRNESCVSISGKAVESKVAKAGFEVLVDSIDVISEAMQTLPIQVNEKGDIKTELATRLDNRFLDLRKPEINAIFKARSEMFKALVDAFDRLGFINMFSPKLTSAGVESGSDMFEVKYFDKKAFLSQSPQIYKQMMVVAGLERVYEIAPVYRAENSNTARHQTEFIGVDFEMGFIKDEHDVMDVIEELMRSIVNHVKEHCAAELEMHNITLHDVEKIPRIPMDELKEMLAKKGKKLAPDDDLDPEAERMVGEYALEEHKSEFIFVTRYPWAVRPFYHMKPEGEPNRTRSFDLLWNGVEIATGAQREHRYDILKTQATDKGVNLDEMRDYAMLFQCGAPPHGGVGFGLDRIAMRLFKLPNIREAILLPRDPERLTP